MYSENFSTEYLKDLHMILSPKDKKGGLYLGNISAATDLETIE
jgi:hypothetical protein